MSTSVDQIARPVRPRGFAPHELSALINEEVVAQHVQEASFGWLLREAAVRAPHYRLRDVLRLDDGLDAHLEGIQLAGECGWRLCEAELGSEEPGEVFAAAAVAFAGRDTAAIEMVLAAGGLLPALEKAIVSALGWLPSKKAKLHIENLVSSSRSELRRIAIAASSIHRLDPGHALAEAVTDPEPRLKARACKAAGELGRMDLCPSLQRALLDEDESCRFWAAWSLVRLHRHPAAWNILSDIVRIGGPLAGRALSIAIRCLPLHQMLGWCREMQKREDLCRLGTMAAGAVGDPSMVEGLIGLMEDVNVARVAGESFALITGVDLAYTDLDGEPPEGFVSGPSEDPQDEDVALDPDENLPWPAAEKVAVWWQQHRHEYQPGTRYLRGKSISAATLREALLGGTQRERAAAALEVALSEPNQPLFEVRAHARRQFGQLQP